MHVQSSRHWRRPMVLQFLGHSILLSGRRPLYYIKEGNIIIFLMNWSFMLYHDSLRSISLGSQRLVCPTCPCVFIPLAVRTAPKFKSCQHVSKLVSKCGKTLHLTLKKYNTVEKSMIPPKLLLTWDEIMDLEFLSHIKTLQGQDDIQTKDWTKKLFCDAVRAWIKLQHAHEELDIIARGSKTHGINQK